MKLEPVHWDDGNQRWRDIAAQAFRAERKATYDYAQAIIELDCAARGATFEGTLTASGLKPNFAYQLKLNGRPSSLCGPDGDDWANEQLGRAGRRRARQVRKSDGNDGIDSAAVAVHVNPATPTAIVAIDMSIQSLPKKWRAIAGTASATTGADGVAVFQTPLLKKTGTVTFTVDGVAKDGQNYTLEGETSDSISGATARSR